MGSNDHTWWVPDFVYDLLDALYAPPNGHGYVDWAPEMFTLFLLPFTVLFIGTTAWEMLVDAGVLPHPNKKRGVK